MDLSSVQEIEKFEEYFWKTSYNGGSGVLYKLESGTVPILLSAAHAMRHFRNGKAKPPELYTGGLVKYLHKVTGCSIMYLNDFQPYDANNDGVELSQYKQALLGFISENNIKFVIDVHGMTEQRDFAVEVGTCPISGSSSLGEYDTILPEIMSMFTKHLSTFYNDKMVVGVNSLFCANGKNTITSAVHSLLSVPCFQVEINADFRDYEKPEQIAACAAAFVEIIELLTSVL